jgi:hypothetical protein
MNRFKWERTKRLLIVHYRQYQQNSLMRKSVAIPKVIFLIAKNLEKALSLLQIYFHSRRKLNYTRVDHLALQLTGDLQLNAVAYVQLFKFATLKLALNIHHCPAMAGHRLLCISVERALLPSLAPRSLNFEMAHQTPKDSHTH